MRRIGTGLPPLVALVAVVAIVSGCGGHNRHPIVLIAEEEVTTNTRAGDALGPPISRTSSVTGSASDIDGVAALQFDVKGSKGDGVVVVEGKKVKGEWGVTSLEIRRPGDADHLVLTGDLDARTGSDTPKFDPNAAKGPSKPTPPPPSEIDIALPPGPPGK